MKSLGLWQLKPIEDLEKEELLEVIEFLMRDEKNGKNKIPLEVEAFISLFSSC